MGDQGRAGEVVYVWGVRWGNGSIEVCDSEDHARFIAETYKVPVVRQTEWEEVRD